MNVKITELSKKRWVQVLFILSILLLAVILVIHLDMTALEAFITKYKGLSVFIFLGIYALLGLTPIPSEPVTFLALNLNGPLLTILLVTAGNTLAAILEFFVGGNLGTLANFEQKKEKLPLKLRQLPVQSPVFLLGARAIPGFGPKFVSIASGVYRVPFTTYLWTAALSNLIGSTVIVLTMSGIITLFN